MENLVETTMCSLCLGSVTRKNCDTIDKHTMDMLGILLPEWNLEEGKHLICNDCSIKLFAAFDFKGTCVNTEDCIFPYVNSEKVGVVDLRVIYSKENDSKLQISENQYVCRFCMQLIFGEFKHLEQLDVNMLNTYIPEINFSSTKNPVICQVCYEAFKAHSVFLTVCLENEKKIKYVNDGSDYIKTEEVHLKTEEVDLETEKVDLQTIEIKRSNLDEEAPEENKIKCEGSEPASGQNNQTTGTKPLELKSYCCDRCSYVTCQVYPLLRHLLNHLGAEYNSFYRCHRCSYTTTQKNDLGTHLLIHWAPSTAQRYSCDKCDYKSIYRTHFIQHQSLHKVKSTEKEHNFKIQTQQLPHKTDMYEGDKCNVNVNMRIFKCKKCTFQTRFKRSLNGHQLIHKRPSELQLYKCDECSFKSKYKKSLCSHKLIHKDLSEIQMHKCDECDFMTRHKKNLHKHKLIHEDLSEMQMYKCDECNFMTKHKRNLHKHKLIHEDP